MRDEGWYVPDLGLGPAAGKPARYADTHLSKRLHETRAHGEKNP